MKTNTHGVRLSNNICSPCPFPSNAGFVRDLLLELIK